ncbi:hypothetical protein HELRODRAFT_161575 [Helobdella robusta]|uniref:F5/8 type C domain-containing protein n=1 Tax=Helobdella robusta TaxID=6412 RepID=T1ERM9_HELRO|nr:hypothetical protein HELRODRAFT_161575 [Helobdella robusta]ESO02320.1 hypothetical protein HELRODRAFT_161575 [Helobdella robusta]
MASKFKDSLKKASEVTGVMTQGRCDGYEWVSRYKVSYSKDAVHWDYVRDRNNNYKTWFKNVSFAKKRETTMRTIATCNCNMQPQHATAKITNRNDEEEPDR